MGSICSFRKAGFPEFEFSHGTVVLLKLDCLFSCPWSASLLVFSFPVTPMCQGVHCPLTLQPVRCSVLVSSSHFLRTSFTKSVPLQGLLVLLGCPHISSGPLVSVYGKDPRDPLQDGVNLCVQDVGVFPFCYRGLPRASFVLLICAILRSSSRSVIRPCIGG